MDSFLVFLRKEEVAKQQSGNGLLQNDTKSRAPGRDTVSRHSEIDKVGALFRRFLFNSTNEHGPMHGRLTKTIRGHKARTAAHLRDRRANGFVEKEKGSKRNGTYFGALRCDEARAAPSSRLLPKATAGAYVRPTPGAGWLPSVASRPASAPFTGALQGSHRQVSAIPVWSQYRL